MRRPVRGWFAILLWRRVLGALMPGAAAGFLPGERADAIGGSGDLCSRMIRALVLSPVFATLASVIVAMKEPGRISGIGTRAVAPYPVTTTPAIVIGIVLASMLRPGAGIEVGRARATTPAQPPPPGPIDNQAWRGDNDGLA